MEYSVKQAVRECHYGERERDCERCPAHHTRAHLQRGSDDDYVCCFGEKHDPHDSVCQNCIHQEDCEEETRENNAVSSYRPPSAYRGGSSVRRNIVSRQGRKSLPIYGQSSVSRYRADEDEDEVEEVIQPQRVSGVQRVEVDHMPFPKQVGVHAAWGAAEGALGMVLNFFQNRRPR